MSKFWDENQGYIAIFICIIGLIFCIGIITKLVVAKNAEYPITGLEFNPSGLVINKDSIDTFDELSFLPYRTNKPVKWAYTGLFVKYHDVEGSFINKASVVKLSRAKASLKSRYSLSRSFFRKFPEEIYEQYKEVSSHVVGKINGNRYFYKIDGNKLDLAAFFIAGDDYHLMQIRFDDASEYVHKKKLKGGIKNLFVKTIEKVHIARDCEVSNLWYYGFLSPKIITSNSRLSYRGRSICLNHFKENKGGNF